MFRLVSLESHRFMARPPCNKCRQGVCVSGDSWCVGCSAQENIQADLRGRWGSTDLRRAACEVLVDAARQVKVLRSLSLRLTPVKTEETGESLKGVSKLVGATPKAGGTPPQKEEDRAGKESAEATAEPDPEESYTYSFSEESEEEQAVEEEVECRRTTPPPPTPREPPVRAPPVQVKREVEKRLEHSRDCRKTQGSSSKEKGRDRGERVKERRRGRRGGRKHQQSHRRRHKPGVRLHKKRGVSELKRLRGDHRGLPPPPPCPR